MKLSLVTVFGLVLCSYAAPLGTIADIEALVERAYEIADRREWVELDARTGDFANTNKDQRERAKDFVHANPVAVQKATEPSHQTGTFASNKEFHLDRQQPTNKDGNHKVAVQLNGKNPSTIGQVVVNKDHNVAPKTVSANLKHSVNLGQEVVAPAPGKKSSGKK